VPLVELLEWRGITPSLANARHVKTVPARKRAWNDAQRLQKLHALGLVRVGTCGEVGEIHTAQPGLRRRNRRQGSPERQLPENAEGQGFARLEGAKPASGAAPALHPTHLRAQPGGRLLESAGARAHPLGESLQDRPVRLHLDEQLHGELAQRLAGVPVAQRFEEVDGDHRPSQVIMYVDR
jgi:hypothetical protein